MAVSETKDNFAPFNDWLVPLEGLNQEEYFTRIRRLENRPDIVVRAEVDHFYYVYLKMGNDIPAINRRELLKLDKNGVTLPRFMFVLGASRDPQYVTYYAVTDRIYGVDLRSVEYEKFSQDERISMAGKIDKSFAGIASYLHESSKKDGWYIGDLSYNRRHTQFMWGRRQGESEDQVYFVDLGPNLLWFSVEDGGSHSNFYGNSVVWLYELIDEMEQRLGKKLSNSRTNLLNLLKDVSPKSSTSQDMMRLKRKLEAES